MIVKSLMSYQIDIISAFLFSYKKERQYNLNLRKKAGTIRSGYMLEFENFRLFKVKADYDCISNSYTLVNSFVENFNKR